MNSGAESMASERYHPLVAIDLRDACEYYDSIDCDLGTRFRTNVQTKFRLICQRPESFGRIGDSFQGSLVSQFLCLAPTGVGRGL